MHPSCPQRTARTLLVALVVSGAVLAGEQGKTAAADDPQREFGDPSARALALRVHADAAAFDKLPRFSYRVETGNADVATMLDMPECSLPELKRALDEPISSDRWYRSIEMLAWSNHHGLWSNSDRQFKNERQESTGDGSRQDRVWTIDSGFERGESSSHPARFVFVPEPGRLWGGCLSQLGYFRITPHRFWWGISKDHNDTTSPIPPALASYRFAEGEFFDGELCDVVESAARAERLWIGRESRRLRGVLVSVLNGAPAEEFHTTEPVEAMAGRSFGSRDDYQAWLAALSEEQKTELSIAWNETYFGQFGPNELIRFRDYREVAPGVWIPFREDRAFTHRTKNVRRKYIHLWAAVQEVRTDVDLAPRVEELQPRDGDQVQDQRFGLVINYNFRRGQTQRELHELVERAVMGSEERGGRQGEGARPRINVALVQSRCSAAVMALDSVTTPEQLEAHLRQKVEVLDSVCRLTAAQKQKLELAARGDLRRTMERIAGIKTRMRTAENDADKLMELREEMLAAWRSLLTLSTDDTLLAGVLETLLTAEQSSRYEPLQRILGVGGRARMDGQGSSPVLAITLNGTALTDNVLQGLADLPNLHYLNLAGTHLTDAGLAHLKKLVSLGRLVLSETKVTDAGLKHLSELRELRELALDSTKVTDAGVAELKAALPGLNVQK